MLSVSYQTLRLPVPSLDLCQRLQATHAHLQKADLPSPDVLDEGLRPVLLRVPTASSLLNCLTEVAYKDGAHGVFHFRERQASPFDAGNTTRILTASIYLPSNALLGTMRGQGYDVKVVKHSPIGEMPQAIFNLYLGGLALFCEWIDYAAQTVGGSAVAPKIKFDDKMELFQSSRVASGLRAVYAGKAKGKDVRIEEDASLAPLERVQPPLEKTVRIEYF